MPFCAQNSIIFAATAALFKHMFSSFSTAALRGSDSKCFAVTVLYAAPSSLSDKQMQHKPNSILPILTVYRKISQKVCLFFLLHKFLRATVWETS